MNLAKGKFIKKIVAVLIIMVMTLADFSLIGANVISYALDMVATNSNNVEFSAYFVKEDDGKQQLLTEAESVINAKNLKLFVEISVKNEGYFNGALEMTNSSFKFIKAESNEYVKTLEGNKVTLNKINAGTTAKVMLNIAYIHSNEIKIDSLSQDNEIKLTGKYTSSEREVQINGTATVKVNWKSPEDIKANLNTKVLTNSKYEISQGESAKANKRIVQLLIDSKLDNNAYPVEETIIELNVPEGAEDVKVHSRSTYATNGNESFNNSNYSYSTESNKLTINLKNEVANGMIDWNKEVKDTLVVTITYPEDKVFSEEKINTEVVIKTYDAKEVKATSEAIISNDIDGIVTNEIIEKEKEIYKGKIYTGEEREYTSTTVLKIDYADLIDSIELSEAEAQFKTEKELVKANIQYKETKIEKAKFDKIFKNDDSTESITIYDQDGAVVAKINNETEVVDGNIVVKYNSGVSAISIKTSKPVSNGIIDIVHTKVISDSKLTREEIRNLVGIYEKTDIKYNEDEATIRKSAENIINLKETSSKANITISTDKLSTITKNENVDIVATLETNDESKDLYNSPIVKIIFPKEIEELHVSQAEALYRNGLEISKKDQEKNSAGNIVLMLEFKNEQKKYDSEILNGLELHFKADIVVNKLTPSKEVSIKMEYTNENGIEETYETSTKINLESKYGLMLYNKVENYNAKKDVVETIDNTKVDAEVDTDVKGTKADVKTVLINNYNVDLKDVEITANLAKEEDKDKIDAVISNLNSSDKNVNLKYNKETNPTAYKATIDTLKAGETIELSYKLNLKDDLSYNMSSNLVTNVTSKNGEKEVKASSTIVLATEEVVVEEPAQGETTKTEEGFTYSIKAISGNKELNENNNSIYNGETIKYTVDITNNTGVDCNNVTIKATQTNGLIYDLVEREVINPIIYADGKGIEHYWEVTDTNIKEFKDKTIKKGETITLQYYTVVNKNDGNKTYANISIISSDNKELDKMETSKYDIKDAELNLLVKPAVSEECFWATDSIQQANLFITNTTKNDLQNVKVKINLSKGLVSRNNQGSIEWNSEAGIEVNNINKVTNSQGQTTITLDIAKINAEQVAEIYIRFYISEVDTEKANVGLFATATTESNKVYTSNSAIREVTQINKKIEVTQTAKINGKDVTSSTIAKNGDELKLYGIIKNSDNQAAKLNIYDYLQLGLNVKSIEIIKNDGTKEDIINSYKDSSLSYEINLKAGEKATIIITVEVEAIYMIDQKAIKNDFMVTDLETGKIYSDVFEITVDTAEFEKDPTPDDGEEDTNTTPGDGTEEDEKDPTPGDGTEEDEKDPTPGDGTEEDEKDPTTGDENEGNDNTTPEKKNFTVSGVAWIDNNKNGRRDTDEELVQNLEVKAINTETNEIISTNVTTNANGSYEITLPQAKYIIIVMYDNENYYITTYKAKGINNDVNSDVVTKTIKVDNEKIVVGATDVINLKENKSNIDIGLISRKKFDLKLEKSISKVVVTTNNGTSEYSFNNEDLAKVEIAAKNLSGSKVLVEYKIKVINIGDIDGYIKKITDYMPSDMAFSSTLNKDWYQSGKYLYNESIANQKLTPGESSEVTLILTKTMTESNTGLVNNTAEIKSFYNEKSFSDANTDNNKDMADVIISVKTGAAVRLVLLTISLTISITVIAYYVTKKYMNRKI